MKKRSKVLLTVVTALVVATLALTVGVLASDNTPALEINGANVSFDSTVHLFYSVGYENVDRPEDIKLLVWHEREGIHINDLVAGTEDARLSSPGEVNEGDVYGRYFNYDGLSAAEMTTNVYARAYTVIDGETVYSPVVKYSILNYALNKLGVTGAMSPTESLRDMLRAMLEYGAMAQRHFFPDSEAPLANEDFVKIELSGTTFADGTTKSLVRVGDQVKLTVADNDKPYVLWSDENGKLLSGRNEYTVTARKNMTVCANPSDEASSFGVYDHVVVIGVDGAGTFKWDGATSIPNIESIFALGAVTYAANIPSPTSSGPSWTSHLHGVPIENHGINDNAFVENASANGTIYPFSNPKYPSYLKAVKDASPESDVAAFYGWQAFDNMIEEGIGVEKTGPAYANQEMADAHTVELVTEYIAEKTPELLFVHLGNVDTVGHSKGWGTAAYYEAVNTADAQIGEIYAALAEAGILEDTLFIVTADHGGTAAGLHGALSDWERYVMFAATGKTVTKNGNIGEMYNRDAAAIVLYALGVERPEAYTAAIPGGLFDGVAAEERTIFNDPDSPRYHLSEGTPAAGAIQNVTDKNVISYMPFDENITELIKGNATSSVGTVSYVPGYFGSAVNLADGHVVMSNFRPGTESFTISMWMKTPAACLESTVLSNKAKGAKLTGIDFSLVRDTSAGWHQGKFNLGYNNTDTTDTAYDIQKTYLPTDYMYGWTHVLLIVDREAGTFSTVYDFGALNTCSINEDYKDASLTAYGLYIGKDANNNPNYPKIDLSIDEFMIFDGALTRNEINDLSEYYGKKPTVPDDPTVLDVLAKAPTVYLDMNRNVKNDAENGYTGALNAVGTPVYVKGVVGEALAMGKGKSYIELADYKLGTESFAFAAWIDLTELFVAQSGNNEYIPLISNMTVYGGKIDGITLSLDYLTGKQGHIFLNASDGTERFNNTWYKTYNFPENFIEGGYVHIAISVNRTRGNETYTLWINFEKVMEVGFKNVYGSGAYSADVDSAEGALTVGQYSGGAFAAPLEANIDELLIFDDYLTDEDIAAMKAFYLGE